MSLGATVLLPVDLPTVSTTMHLSTADIERARELINAMQPQIEQALAAYAKFAPELAKAAKSYAKSMADIRKGAQVLGERVTETTKQVVAWYQEQAATLEPALKQIAQQYRALEQSTDRGVIPILRSRRWFGLERYFTPWEFQRLIAAYRKGKAKSADKYVCDQFGRNRFRRLGLMTKDWWKIAYMKKRRSKVRQALRAYRKGQYALVVPILLTFADGLSHAYFQANPTEAPPRKPGKKPSVLVPDAASHDAPIRPDYAGLLAAAIQGGMYKSYRFGIDRAPLAVNRHGVLHGDTVGFDTRAYALRTILLLDAICRVALAGPKIP